MPDFRRLEAVSAEQLIGEGVVCMVAQQGDYAGQCDICVAALEAIAITSWADFESDAPRAGVRG